MNEWKYKGEIINKSMFCKKCEKCIYTKEDIISNFTRDYCSTCSEYSTETEYNNDIVPINFDV